MKTLAALLLLTACAPGERLGVVENGVCLCPDIDAGVPDASVVSHPHTRMHLFTDSTWIGGASDVSMRAASLFASTYPGSFKNQATPGRHLYFYAYDAARRETIARNLAGVYPVAETPSDLWIALAYNDYGGAYWSAADYGLAYADLVDRIHYYAPDMHIWCQTAIRDGRGLNAKGSSLNDYSAAAAAACTGRPNTHVVWGLSIGLANADFADAAHLRDSGHAKLAAAAELEVLQ